MEKVNLNISKEYLAECRNNNLEALNDIYGEYVDTLIRQRYSQSAEIALIRQQLTKPNEWEEYNSYCEQCKARAKYIIKEIDLNELCVEIDGVSASPQFPPLPFSEFI